MRDNEPSSTRRIMEEKQYEISEKGISIIKVVIEEIIALTNILDSAITAEGKMARGFLGQIAKNLTLLKNEIKEKKE